ncbi:Sister chromatid cohesion protein PDS5 [Vitis vinifera]|uniref:Sister chromatid cohesion protein PDS5 n=1 Tax=Vitis vinifera TaxID=29760 RepID=A0A438IBJ9_VITVI|nr:Sister chromatid cohesion protein PDS5 [Vitis vinifera]
MASASNGFEAKLRDVGNRLLHPPSSADELLPLLEKAESYLAKVEQQPCMSTKIALSTLMEALVADQILKHGNGDVKVSAVACISEITRITAPDAPYDDNQMTEIFRLTVASFENLSDMRSPCYSKAVSILKSVATYRWCLVMLDLECDRIIIDMFQLFLNVIRSDHPEEVFSAMETIMTLVMDESEYVSVELLSPILATNVSPICWRLGEKAITNCAAKLRPYLMEVVKYLGTRLSDYAPAVATICQNESNTRQYNLNVSGSRAHLVAKVFSEDVVCPREVGPSGEESLKSMICNDASQTKKDTFIDYNSFDRLNQRSTRKKLLVETADKPVKITQKRSWKPYFLVNPEEGYDYCWIGRRKRANPRKIITEASSI